MLLKTLGCIAAAVLIAVCVQRVHWWLISLEDRGYIYYRKKRRGGGGAGVFMEVDKMTRPTVERVQKAMDTEVISQEIDGE